MQLNVFMIHLSDHTPMMSLRREPKLFVTLKAYGTVNIMIRSRKVDYHSARYQKYGTSVLSVSNNIFTSSPFIYMQTNIQLVLEHLETLDTSDLISIHNQYCQNHNYSDDEIYGNDEDFFSTFFQNNPYEVARSTFYGDYNFSHDYVHFN